MAADPTANQFNIHEAKTNLSRLVDRVEHGEEIVISRAGTPVARLVPIAPRRLRRGSLADRIVLSPDWDSPEVNEALAAEFGATER
jgi:prevent-host-death family protein